MLRRAAELDREHAKPLQTDRTEPRIEEAELERIAAESGLTREAVRRAIDELRGGALPGGGEDKRGPRRTAGEAAVVEATFEEPAEALERRLQGRLSQGGLQPVRRAAHATRWEPAAGLHHALGRAVDWRGTSAWIGCAVESSVYGIAGERSAVQLRGDAKDTFFPIAVVTALLLAFPAGLALLVALAVGLRAGFGPAQALACALILLCWAALTALISRGVARRRVRKLRRALERTLASLAQPTGNPKLNG